jgi:hypothetical protein
MNAGPRLACTALLLAGLPVFALAAQDSQQGSPNKPQTATVELAFVVDIGKFIFFRVGNGGYPTASGTADTVTFNAVPVIPPGAVLAVPGNNTTVNWGGTVPSFASTATTLPVEVRSNAGQISIRATATLPLTSGVDSIPLSQIVLTSSDANLPAPVVPDTGTGPAVNVAATAFSNLVTVRNANWTFSYAPPITQQAGNYTGQISFTASSP